jgi:hypothetical protein
MDPGLTQRWLKAAGIRPSPQFEADGTLTRGEFLNRLYAVVEK